MSKGVTREDVVAVYKTYFCFYKIRHQGAGYESLYAAGKTAAERCSETLNRDVMTIPDLLNSIASISGDLPGVGVILDCMEMLGMIKPSESGEEIKIDFEEGPES